MDEKRTTQALKQIFDQCGTGVLRDRHRFEAFLEDLLSGGVYASERRLLRHALDSDALPLLLRTPAFTPDTARQAVETLQNDIYVSEEAARFVVRCVIAARGGDPGLANGPAPRPSTPPPPRPAPSPPPPPRPSAPAPSQPTPPPSPAQSAPAPTVQTVSCSLANQKGEAQMFPDKLIFTPSTARKRTEVSYQKIQKIEMHSTSQMIAWGWKINGVFWFLYAVVMSLWIGWQEGSLDLDVFFIFCAVSLAAWIVMGLIFTLWYSIKKTNRITIRAGRTSHVFLFEKNQRQCEQMYAVVRRGMHQYT